MSGNSNGCKNVKGGKIFPPANIWQTTRCLETPEKSDSENNEESIPALPLRYNV